MTEQERKQFQEELLGKLNRRADCEDRKATVTAEFNKELKAIEASINDLRLQLNNGTVEFEPQMELAQAK